MIFDIKLILKAYVGLYSALMDVTMSPFAVKRYLH